MTRQEIYENIKIARHYLNTYHLLLHDNEVLFDCYCLPSFRYKAFYAQISIKDGVYKANCTYTRYVDYLGIESYSCHFTTIENNERSAIKNDIFCKVVFPNSETIDRLISLAQEYIVKKDTSDGKKDTSDGSIIIDGITAGIRLFDNGNIIRDIFMINPDMPELLLDEICSFSEII